MVSKNDKDFSLTIQNLLAELGVVCINKGVQETPTKTIFHYNIADKSIFGQVEKKVKFLSAFLHQGIKYCKSDIAHFALAIEKENNEEINFTAKRFKSLFDDKKPSLNMFVGVDENNLPVVINLEEMPHILVAGTTGSGKSILLNDMICSILKNDKKACLYLMDTKRVEFSPFMDHDRCNVAVDIPGIVNLLEGICISIEQRYEFMEKMRYKKLPREYKRIVVVIDELGDLMLSHSNAIEPYIVKIAQLGRACGVHLIIATQKPTIDVLTGQIKANITCRIALKTATMSDSRVILDKNGAELLNGKGDSILKVPMLKNEIHMQCPMIKDEDIYGIIKQTNRRNKNYGDIVS